MLIFGVAEERCDAGEDAGLVDDGDPDVVARYELRHGDDARWRVFRRVAGAAAADDALGGIEDVGDDGAGRGEAGAGALEVDAADEVAFDLDGVEDAIDLGQRGIGGQEDGVDARLDAAIDAGGEGEQLDRVAELGGVAEIAGGELRDALAVDVVALNRGVERRARRGWRACSARLRPRRRWRDRVRRSRAPGRA